ncbi:DUF2798 domain-containing protein [Acidovorax sp. ACV01]|uniref:DUF2798 domain-containing protein n=1 Tax=Acidovorax sp. ACV01 TaxID=2769311 RepID=UPI00177D8A0A|nr:DUF2798 domain-containing protein [Acidovorax sp. ACV01]MBD9391210.1 DUF2798 domain-containing protein [Acidovorax sp. ACV01]
MKFHPRYAPVIFGGLLSTIMVSVVSGLLLFLNEGFHPGFAAVWLKNFLSTWPVVFPTALVVAPWVRRIVANLTLPIP